MIDINTYRIRIGCYNPYRFRNNKDKYGLGGSMFHNFRDERQERVMKLLFVIYLYFIIMIMCVSQSILMLGGDLHMQFWGYPSILSLNTNHNWLITSIIHTKLLYLCLVTFILINIIYGRYQNANNSSKLRRFTPANIFFGNNTTKIKQLFSTVLIAIVTLNYILIAIVNPSMLNPGPGNASLSVYFQNVQGLIPFSNLGVKHPSLDRAKIFELNQYISDKKPDLVVLNETWLNGSIGNNEVIENSNYTIYRCDRSELSHPRDPRNSNKFKQFGGGVLIAIRSDIEANPTKISVKKGAEILAIETTFNGSKFIFCTCYRVGTLGTENYDSIADTIRSFFRSKRPKKIFVVGDFNLHSVTWPVDDNSVIHNPTDKNFVDTFNDVCLSQCITSPTHIKGKTLDILLTNYDSLIQDIIVHEHNSICKSDHYPITFEITTRLKRIKPIKRKRLNFKRANWDALNNDLCQVEWNAILDCMEPEIAWSRFKSELSYHVNKHIPSLTIKSEFQPPWFDSETYHACQDKERARKKFKQSNNKLDELKYIHSRRQFKSLCNQKMRDNMYNTDDPAVITKKFWSHHKFSTKSHRLPECMYYKNSFRNKPYDKATMFNNYFYEQFSEPSNYDIHIDYANDHNFDLTFSHREVRKLLSRINANKAGGPDGIHGKILKNCAVSLAYPLSLLFKITYNTGCIPREWKLAHVVPVHKKGAKENIENYRPISLTSLVMKTFERLLKEEILSRTSHLLDNRQHGFLSNKSCTTNMTGFCDSLALSMNNSHSTDIIYLDFAKAFDSVNHDLILCKLQTIYHINDLGY